jgi:hypothetical protein
MKQHLFGEQIIMKPVVSKLAVTFLLLFLIIQMTSAAYGSTLQSTIPASAQNTRVQSDNSKTPEEKGQISSLGPMLTGDLAFSISFGVRNSEGLNSFIENLQQTAGKKFLSEEQFEASFSPTKEDYDQVLNYLVSHNLEVTQKYDNRLMILAKGPVADVEAAFNTQIGLYSSGNETFYKSSSNISVPTALSACQVNAVNVNSYRATPHINTIKESLKSGYSPNAYYGASPSDFRELYGTTSLMQSGWTGSGITIGIVDAYGDPTLTSDVNSFINHFNLPAISLTVAGTGGTPNNNWDLETALDVEWAHAMAPQASILLQLAADNSGNNLFGAVNTLVSMATPPSVISLSWGGTEDSQYSTYYTQTTAPIFAAAVAKGIRVYVSTGDHGAYDDGTNRRVEYPASDPNVIAVGGTEVYDNWIYDSSGNPTQQFYEYGWSGSGGGYSIIFPEPSYQSGAGITDPTGKRAVPDVSLDASDESSVLIYLGGSIWYCYGTSLASPMMAAITACASTGGLTLNNAAFYSMYGSSYKYNLAFHDIHLSGNNGYYSVQTGWDAVTGLGSINLQNYNAIYNQASGVTLTSQSLNTTSVIMGHVFQSNYEINNPNSGSSLNQIGLGLSIRLHGTTTEIKDPYDDIYLTIPGGSSSQNRQFWTSDSLSPGSYDVMWRIWMGPPDLGNLISSSNWVSDQLQIELPPEFNFRVDASPSSRGVSAGGSTTYTVTVTLTGGTSQAISLSCSPPITGVTYSFDPSVGDATFTSVLTVQSSSNTPEGNCYLTITGVGNGLTRSASAAFCIQDAYEPDDSFSQYSIMTVTTTLQSQSRSLEPAGDNDYIRFYANPGNYTFYTSSTNFVDTYGYLYNSNQNQLAYDDDSAGSLQFRINYIISSVGYYFLRVRGYDIYEEGAYTLYYIQTVNTDSYEPDNSFDQYSSITITTTLQSQSRSIAPAGDNDYIRFSAVSGNYTFFSISSLDTYGYLYDSSHTQLAVDDNSGGNLQFRLTYSITASGYYFLRICDSSATETGVYTLYCQYIPASTTLQPTDMIWNNTYGGLMEEYAHSMIKTSDGGYAITGNTYSYGAGHTDYWLVKTNSAGTLSWSKTYGGTSYDNAYALVEAYDGGLLVLGESQSYGAGGYDFWLVKTNSAGTQSWTKTYGGTSSEKPSAIIKTSDGGYAMAGYTYSYGAGGNDMYLVKIDSAGNMLWNTTYGGNMNDAASSVIQTSDGGYMLVGTTSSFGVGSYRDIYMVKVDSNGNQLWYKLFGSTSGYESASRVIQTDDDGYMIAGQTNSFGAGGYDMWLIKTDSDGNQVWSKTFGGTSTENAVSVAQTVEGGYIVAGNTNSFGVAGDVWLIRLNSEGDQIWNRTYGGYHIEEACSIVLSGSDYIVGGDTSSYGPGLDSYYPNFWLFEAYDTTYPAYQTPQTPNSILACAAMGSDNTIWYRICDDSNWTDWTNLIGSTEIEPATAIYQGNLYIAAIDGSTHIWLSTVDLNTYTWSGWSMWQNTYASSVTFAASDDYLAIVARGTDNSIWYRVYDGSNWTDWVNLVGSTTIEPAVAIYQNNLYIAAIDGSTHIWLSSVDLNTQVWSGWSMLPNTYAASVTFASSADKLVIVARALDGSIWYRIFNGSTWTDWTYIIASTTIEPAAAIYQGLLYIAAIDGSNHIWLSTVDLNTQAWSGWSMWPNTCASSVTFAS